MRGCDLDEFFGHANQSYPPSLSQFGTLGVGTKSSMVSCLDKLSLSQDNSPDVDATLLDSAAIINMLKPGFSKTIFDYFQIVFTRFVQIQLQNVNRVDTHQSQPESNFKE